MNVGGIRMMDLSINETIKYNKSGPARILLPHECLG